MKRYGALLLIIVSVLLTGCFKGKPAADMEKETMSAAPETTVLAGYLVDVTCGSTGKGMDGSNLVFNPEEHTLHCLEVCKASGFGVMTKDQGADSYHFVEFDDKGNELALALLDAATEEGGIAIRAEGTLDRNLLAVSTLERTN